MVFTFSVMLIMLQSQDLNVKVSWKKITNPTPVDYEHVYSWFDELQYMYKKTYFNLNMLGKK